MKALARRRAGRRLPVRFLRWLEDIVRRGEDQTYHGRPLTEDAVAEARARACATAARGPCRFLSAEHLAHWLRLCAYRAQVDIGRKSARHRSLPDDLDLPDRGPGPAEAAARAEEAARVRQAMAGLSAEQRFVLVGYYWHGKTDVELGTEAYGAESSARAQGLRIHRLRHQGEDALAQRYQRRR